MSKESEPIPVVVIPFFDLIPTYMAATLSLLDIAKANITLSAELTSRTLKDWDAQRPLSRPHPGLLRGKKALKVTLSEIDKLIEKVESDLRTFVENSSMNYNTNKETNE